ncbi:hypothetical protein [Patulibacter defluvii]|uniref:hypothetical protein n=1 Tax=Patulibacter defluvii TaxID=3095358 RepID=UPI002A75B11D|nr:hypothetical protein [Patulibacter sp. DM4]
MSAQADVFARLQEQFDGLTRTLSAVQTLDARQAEQVAARMDRLASQLLEVTPPVPMSEVYARLGATPATEAEFSALVDQMGPADGEG